MTVRQVDNAHLVPTLKATSDESVDFIVIVSAPLDPANPRGLIQLLGQCVRALRPGGLLFLHGQPEYLPELGVVFDRELQFKYWIAVESDASPKPSGLPSVHSAVLLLSKGSGRFNVKRTRTPHEYCDQCKKPLKDWGGKTHLMNPAGKVISDVWRGIHENNGRNVLSQRALTLILNMPDFDLSTPDADRPIVGIVGPSEGLESFRSGGIPSDTNPEPIATNFAFQPRPQLNESRSAAVTTDTSQDISARKLSEQIQLSSDLVNVVHCGDLLKVLSRYPDNSVDLAFADPPYNLDKSYTAYDDEREKERYLSWCNDWLREYVRVLKPSGSLYVLNLPHWTMYHAEFLNRHMHMQNWIVWDALSEPLGKLMPAHYGLLFYTKHPTKFTFNYDDGGRIDSRRYCLRPACIRQRKAVGRDDKEALTDIWWDIHRIKHRRDRDYHPCQLPNGLMERIIRLSTNSGDVVLDGLCGTGTTPVAALKLGRQYVAVDTDQEYVRIAHEKIASVKRWGRLQRKPTRKSSGKYTKKELQLELRELAASLGRLPTPDDVVDMSEYELQAFLDSFPTWGKALKAAKLDVAS